MICKAARTILLGAASLLTVSCAGQLATNRAAVDYNRAFADSRNEVLLLNILRAWRDEPLQFSAMSQVNGAIRGGATLNLNFQNVILGASEVFNPGLSVTSRNPNVTIAPLDGSSFVTAMTSPVSLQVIDTLLSQGWDANLVLGLAFGGVTCPRPAGPENVYNDGTDAELDREFLRVLLATPGDFDVVETQAKPLATLQMTDSEAAELLSTGVGTGRRVGEIQRITTPVQNSAPQGSATAADQPGRVAVPILPAASYAAKGLDMTVFCAWEDRRGRHTPAAAPPQPTPQPAPQAKPPATAAEGTSAEPAKEETAAPAPTRPQLLPRSVQSMIQYVAALHGRNFAAQAGSCWGRRRRGAQWWQGNIGTIAAPASQAPQTSSIAAGARQRSEGVSPSVEQQPSSAAGGTNAVAAQPPLIEFQIQSRCSVNVAPVTAFVSTPFENRTFFVPRATHLAPGDETLDILRLLTQLIALQTTDQLIAASRPVVVVAPQ